MLLEMEIIMINLLKFFKNNIGIYLKYLKIKNLPESKYNKFLIDEYLHRTGNELDFSNLVSYTEKMQYAKLYKNNSLKTRLSDKYAVREWVAQKIGEEYLIPIYGAWNNYKEIDFENLPNEFVLKTNHGSGFNEIIRNKAKMNKLLSKVKFDYWMNIDFEYYTDLQPHYKGINKKIIAEKYLTDSDNELKDYKFLCFNGEVHFVWVDVGRYSKHYRNVYNLNWELQPWKQHHYDNYPYEIPKPKNLNKMIEIAKVLCQGFSQVRVDLYNVDGDIYFGEMTFTNGSGFELIYPNESNIELGNLWNLNDYEV